MMKLSFQPWAKSFGPTAHEAVSMIILHFTDLTQRERRLCHWNSTLSWSHKALHIFAHFSSSLVLSMRTTLAPRPPCLAMPVFMLTWRYHAYHACAGSTILKDTFRKTVPGNLHTCSSLLLIISSSAPLWWQSSRLCCQFLLTEETR